MALANTNTLSETQARSRHEDQELVNRFLNGEQSAFSRLVNKYRRQVYAVAFRFARNHEEAADLTQDTFIKAFQNLHSFRGDAAFKTWLMRITTNLSINMTKSGRVSKDSGEAPDDSLEGQPQPALEGLLEDERKIQLRRAITKLPPKQKETLMLKTYRNMTCEEVAAVMKCSVGTVKANVFNAVKRLKSLMNPGG